MNREMNREMNRARNRWKLALTIAAALLAHGLVGVAGAAAAKEQGCARAFERVESHPPQGHGRGGTSGLLQACT